jgi:hypothetical protein
VTEDVRHDIRTAKVLNDSAVRDVKGITDFANFATTDAACKAIHDITKTHECG